MKKDPTIARVWVTKYALTRGIEDYTDVQQCLDTAPDGRMISVNGSWGGFFHKPDWHLTYNDAVLRVLEIIESAQELLVRKENKLNKLEAKFRKELAVEKSES